MEKTVIAPIAYLIAAASIGTFSHFAEFVVLWMVLEFLLYYARYQWNDVRGIDNDRVHPARLLRARLPVGETEQELRRNVRVSLAAASARVAAAVFVGLALDRIEAVVILIAAVGSSAVLYESVRSASTPRFLHTPGRYEVGVWLAVGLGYAIRVGLGLALAGIPFGSLTMAVGLAYAFAAGTMYVLLSWALEASSFCAWIGRDLVVAEEIRRKPHIAALVGSLSRQREDTAIHPTHDPISPSTPGHLGSVAALAPCAALGCPWNLALTIGAPLAGLLGTGLAGLPYWPNGVAAALVCLGGAIALQRCKSSSLRWITVVAVASALALLAAAADPAWPWAGSVPWLAMAACYSSRRSSSYLDSMRAGNRTRLADPASSGIQA